MKTVSASQLAGVTTVALYPADRERLAILAAARGVSRSRVIRELLAAASTGGMVSTGGNQKPGSKAIGAGS